jgi:hypothetical protein
LLPVTEKEVGKVVKDIKKKSSAGIGELPVVL